MVPVPGASGRSEDSPSFLGHCLVESDRSQEKRDRRNKQRALVISIVVQILIVAALAIFPLFSKGENIIGRVLLYPGVPYNPARPHHVGDTGPQRPITGPSGCRFCMPTRIPPTIVTRDDGHSVSERGGSGEPDIPGLPPGPGTPGGLDPFDPHGQPPPPPPQKDRIIIGHIEPAMLVHRVEPVYPTLAIQLHREGRVELRAIISTDGTIQELQVISGDPLLINSSLAAVREWRYRPTILNGKAVEVDTHITVVYTLSH